MSRDCASCHHQMIGTLALAVVAEKSFPVEPAKLAVQQERIRRHVARRQVQHLFGTSGGNPAISQSYALVALAALGEPASEATDAAVHLLASRQSPSGSWPSLRHQAPLEDSAVTATALSIRALGAYPLPGRADELGERIARAATWLEQARPRDTEDRVMQLLGLYWSGRSGRSLGSLLERLAAEQNADGGWGQVAGRRSDAYATGEALLALQQVGELGGDDPLIRRGVEYLLATSHEPTSWHVRSRVLETREDFFESGYPHGRDQFISYAASAWATAALALAARPGGAAALAPVTAPRPVRPSSLPPLIAAALFGTADDVAALLAAGEDPDCRGPLGLTTTIAALHDPTKLRLLLERGADANAETEIGLRAIHVAAFSDATGAATRLLLEHGAKPGKRTPTGLDPAYLAAVSGHLEALDALRAAGARSEPARRGLPSPLLAALRRDDLVTVRRLVGERGPDTAPRWATARPEAGDPLLALAVKSRSAALIRTLTEHGADPNVRDARGRTPLHLAAALGAPEVVRELLAAGADPTLEDPVRRTPADAAVAGGNEFLVALLSSP